VLTADLNDLQKTDHILVCKNISGAQKVTVQKVNLVWSLGM